MALGLRSPFLLPQHSAGLLKKYLKFLFYVCEYSVCLSVNTPTVCMVSTEVRSGCWNWGY